jgi:cytochrome P450 / NADPH-cytochrome P450 reductase
MDTRFNSFYREDLHPFVRTMVGMLVESGARVWRPAFVNYFLRSVREKFDADIALLKMIAGEVVAKCRAHPSD